LTARVACAGLRPALKREYLPMALDPEEIVTMLPARDAGNRLELAARVLMLPPR
jgi:hypothetical protein